MEGEEDEELKGKKWEVKRRGAVEVENYKGKREGVETNFVPALVWSTGRVAGQLSSC